MADIQDSSQTFTITLLTNGIASIVSIEAPTEAYEGDTIPITVTVQNNGGEDTIFAKITDVDDTLEVGARQETVLATGSSTQFSWSLTMPAKTWNLRADVGHTE